MAYSTSLSLFEYGSELYLIINIANLGLNANLGVAFYMKFSSYIYIYFIDFSAKDYKIYIR